MPGNLLCSLHNVPKLDNAFFTGTFMVYGNGKKYFFAMGTLDTAGHELGHGVVQEFGPLVYQGESGALNESYADICGACFEFFMYEKNPQLAGKSDWLQGEDSGNEIAVMGNMMDPHQSNPPQPAAYQNDPYWGDPNSRDDDGYVHGNSGLGNYIFYLVATNVFGASLPVAPNPWAPTWNLWLEVLKILRPRSRYTQFRDVLLQAASRFNPEHPITEPLQAILLKVNLGPNVRSKWRPRGPLF